MGEDQCNIKHWEMTVEKQMGFFFIFMNRYVSVTQPWCSQLWNAYFVTHSTFKKRSIPGQAWNEAVIWHSHDTVWLLDSRNINGDMQYEAISFYMKYM